MTPNWTQMTWPEMYSTWGDPYTASSKFSSVSLYGQSFSRYCTFYDFSIDSHVEITKCHKIFKTWPIAKKATACIPSVSQSSWTLIINIGFNFWRIAKKLTDCINPDCHAFHKVWLKLDENCGSSSPLKILTLEILKSAPHDTKLNSNVLTRKLPYMWRPLHRKSQIFIRFAVRPAVFKLLYSLWFTIYVKFQSFIKIEKYKI